jgi:hypothetical protein
VVDDGAEADACSEPVADLHGGQPVGQGVDESVGDAVLDEDAVGGDAGLSAVAHLGGERSVDCPFQVDIVEDQQRGVSAQFHGALQYVVGREAQEHFADPGGTGEGHLAHPWIGQHGGAQGGASVVVVTCTRSSGTPAATASWTAKIVVRGCAARV